MRKQPRPRPRMFDERAFREFLSQQNCPEALIGSTVSDFKLLLPLLLKALGPDEVRERTLPLLRQLGLQVDKGVDEHWRMSVQYAMDWTKAELARYQDEL